MSAKSAPVVVLIGLRGAGKSTIGRLLAAQLGGSFVDLDCRTAARLGFPAAGAALAAVGEAEFRSAEAQELALAVAEPISVLALGGGTPTAPGASQLLKELSRNGRIRIVYLRSAPTVLRQRLLTHGSEDRPSLTGRGTLEEIESVFAARDPLYCALASEIVEVAGRAAEAIAGTIAKGDDTPE